MTDSLYPTHVAESTFWFKLTSYSPIHSIVSLLCHQFAILSNGVGTRSVEDARGSMERSQAHHEEIPDPKLPMILLQVQYLMHGCDSPILSNQS